MSVPYITEINTYKNGTLTTAGFMEPEEYTSSCVQELTDASGEAFAIKAADYDSSTASDKILYVSRGVSRSVVSAWHPMNDDDPNLLDYYYVRWYNNKFQKPYADLTYSVTVDVEPYKCNRFFHEIAFTVRPTFSIDNHSYYNYSWEYTWSNSWVNIEFGPEGTDWGLEFSYSVEASWTPGSQGHVETHSVSCTFSIRTTGQGSDAGEAVTVTREYSSEDSLAINFEPFTFTALYTDAAYLPEDDDAR